MDWNDKEKVAKYKREYQRKWRKDNPDKIKQYTKNYREGNRKTQRRWKRNNPEKVSISAIFYAIEDRCSKPKTDAYKYYGKKGIKNKLTLEQLKRLWDRDGACLMKRPSIDRRNSKGNYEYDNCRFMELSDNIKRAWEERRLSNGE